MLYCHYRVGHERQKRNEHSADIHSSAAVKAERQYKRCRIKYQYKNPSSQAYAHVFSANFAADCVKNPCRAKARLRIFAYSATKLCSKIRTHFL